MSISKNLSRQKSVFWGAAFLMATSAIGPGFITQTTVFTEKLATSFGFVILCSIILDIIVQLTIWRVTIVSGLTVQQIVNRVLYGAGHLISVLVVVGGLAFNIGNLAGAALGIQVVTGAPIWIGVLISAIFSIAIFWFKEAGKTLDLFTKILGIAMILLTFYVVIKSQPSLSNVIAHAIAPPVLDTTAIIILVGGTVGGYISFAGAHRLLDAGIKGPAHLKTVTINSIRGILLASLMRILLFLAAWGVVSAGVKLNAANPAATVFETAAGQYGLILFGIVLWCAAITSVVGSAFTSISFVETLRPSSKKFRPWLITIFIVISAIIFLFVGKPVKTLVIVGALNAFVLPIALVFILLASRKNFLLKDYKHPVWLGILGWFVVVALTIMSVKTLLSDLPALWR